MTSVLVQSARLSPPENEVHRIDTAWIIKERYLVIPADVLDWERLLPERGLSFSFSAEVITEDVSKLFVCVLKWASCLSTAK